MSQTILPELISGLSSIGDPQGWFQPPVTHYTFGVTVGSVVYAQALGRSYLSSAAPQYSSARMVPPTSERLDEMLDSLVVKREGMFRRLK